MTKGKISLVYREQILQCLTYSNSNRRRTIISLWKKLYGKAFDPEMLKDQPERQPQPRQTRDSRTPLNNAILR